MGYALLTTEQTEEALRRETVRISQINLVHRVSDSYADDHRLTGHQRENFFRVVVGCQDTLLGELEQFDLSGRAVEDYLAARFDRFRDF